MAEALENTTVALVMVNESRQALALDNRAVPAQIMTESPFDGHESDGDQLAALNQS